MNPNYERDVCNCRSGECSCPNGYECCSEKVPGGKEPKFGLCCKKGSCDGKTGHCLSPDDKRTDSDLQESYRGGIRESYNDDDDCSSWRSAYWFLFITLIVVFLGIFYLGFYRRY